MKRSPDDVSENVASRLDAMLRLSLLARERPVLDVLAAVAEIARDVLGYRAVVVNLYRPAWHDYEAVLVLGAEHLQEALLGSTNAYGELHDALLQPRYEQVTGAYFLPAGTASWEEMETTYTVLLEPASGGGWQPNDGLLVPLRGVDGRPLGLISVDDPLSGERPTDADLQLLVAVCSHAALALDTAQARREAEAHERAVERVIAFVTELPRDLTPRQVMEHACLVAEQAMGFEAVSAYLREERGYAQVCERGRNLDISLLGVANVQLDAQGLGWMTARKPSPRAGTGPLAWGSELLCVAVRGSVGGEPGMLVLADPVDSLLPSNLRRQELRLLADQTAAALAFAHRERRLATLANQDPLTGLRNRRDLEQTIAGLTSSGRGLAVVVFDLDHFKEINDEFGHAFGDRVLADFAKVLTEYARSTDIAVRLGGEEFCLLLPGADTVRANAVAERVRAAVPLIGDRLGTPMTVSGGIAVFGPDLAGPHELLVAADRALYAAKRGGRNRICA